MSIDFYRAVKGDLVDIHADGIIEDMIIEEISINPLLCKVRVDINKHRGDEKAMDILEAYDVDITEDSAILDISEINYWESYGNIEAFVSYSVDEKDVVYLDDIE